MHVRLIKEEELSQSEVAKMMKISQPRVSRLLQLLKLHPTILKKVLKEEVRVSTAYLLSRLPPDEQVSFKKPTLKAVGAKLRDLAVSSELKTLLETVLPDQPKEIEEREVICPGCGEKFKVGI